MSERRKPRQPSKRTAVFPADIPPQPEPVSYICKFCSRESVSYPGRTCCPDCSGIVTGVPGSRKKSGDPAFHKDYLLKITYDAKGYEHEGYCSDPGEKTKIRYQDSDTFPALKLFTIQELDQGTIDPYHPLINSYYQRTGYGYGWCGCGVKYRPIKVEIVKAN